MAAILLYIEAAMKLAPALIQTGADVSAFAKQVYSAIKSGKDPSPEDWAALSAMEDRLRNELQAPLPEE